VRCVLFIVCVLVLSGCSANRYYNTDERALGTTRRSPALNHLAVYYPGGISLNAPGYLIGIEDSLPYRIAEEGDLKFSGPNGNGRTIEYLKDQLRDGKLPFISHIIHYAGNHYGDEDCALYNYYRDHNGDLMPFCDSVKQDPVNRSNNNYHKAYANSWIALDILKSRLEADVASGKYTHVVVMMMGMDTTQEQSVRDFNTLVWSLRNAGGDQFRPLVIGISWPSFFDSRWLDPIWETLAYPSKADEADKIGLTWVGVLMHDIIGPLRGRVKTMAVVHSFGARAVSMAACVGPEIVRVDGYRPRVLDYFVGFAPAFSLHRFLKARYLAEDIRYPDACRRGGKIILTSSNHDYASKMPIWVDLAGNYDDYRKFCRRKHEIARTCLTVDSKGQIQQEYADSDRFLYIDTTQLMQYQIPNTDGGAHSDIFRSQVGRMIWSIVQRPSPAHQ